MGSWPYSGWNTGMEITTPILVLAVTGILAGFAMAILAMLIIGIRRGDRGHLSNSPRSNSDAFARRILVGVRYPRESEEGDDQ
jgi:hypothetical protein